MTENILDIARRVREPDGPMWYSELRSDAVALAEAVELMVAFIRDAAGQDACNFDHGADARFFLRELGIPLEEAGDEG